MMKFLKARRIQGFLVLVASITSMFTGVTIDPAIIEQIVTNVESLITLGIATAGLIWNLWGGLKAKGPLIK